MFPLLLTCYVILDLIASYLMCFVCFVLVWVDLLDFEVLFGFEFVVVVVWSILYGRIFGLLRFVGLFIWGYCFV